MIEIHQDGLHDPAGARFWAECLMLGRCQPPGGAAAPVANRRDLSGRSWLMEGSGGSDRRVSETADELGAQASAFDFLQQLAGMS